MILHTNMPKQLTTLIDMFKANHNLPEKVAEGLKSHNPKTPTLKLPPKMHHQSDSAYRKPLQKDI